MYTNKHLDSPGGSVVKNPPAIQECGFNTGVKKILWRRNGNPLQYSCLGHSMDRRSLVDYSPWSHKRVRRCRDLITITNTYIQRCVSFYINLSMSTVGEGNGNTLQYSCLENPMDGGAW